MYNKNFLYGRLFGAVNNQLSVPDAPSRVQQTLCAGGCFEPSTSHILCRVQHTFCTGGCFKPSTSHILYWRLLQVVYNKLFLSEDVVSRVQQTCRTKGCVEPNTFRVICVAIILGLRILLHCAEFRVFQ